MREDIKLSPRLLAICQYIKGESLADIGTDHGHIPIYLLQKGRMQRAFALDLRPGPLERARENVIRYGLEKRITLGLSNGLRALTPGAVQTILIAGMGGDLIVRILEEGRRHFPHTRFFVLSPHTRWEKCRKYLWENGFVIEEEGMVKDEGKFYPIIRAVYTGIPVPLPDVRYQKYGRYLVEKRDPVLREYLENRLVKQQEILQGFPPSKRKKAEEIEQNIREIKECLDEMY